MNSTKLYIHILAALAVCFVWPMGGLLYALLSAANKYKASIRELVILIIAVSFYLAYINTTKTASSDTIYYLVWYKSIDRSDPMNSFLFYRGTFSVVEPLFNIISIIINYITLGSETGYLFLCTFLIYSVQLYAILIVANKFNIPSRFIICIFFMLSFANPLFIQSIHALRQMIATSFLMLAIAYHCVNGRNNWWLYAASILTHMSVIAYLPIVALGMAYKKITIKRLLFMSVLMFVLIQASQSIGTILGSSSFVLISAVGEKIANTGGHNLMDLSLRGFYLYNIPFAIIAIISLMHGSSRFQQINVYYYLYVITFLVVVLNPISTEVSVRYAFYIFSFFPYLFIAYCLTNKASANMVVPAVAVALTLIFWGLLAGDNSYANIFTLLFDFFPFF